MLTLHGHACDIVRTLTASTQRRDVALVEQHLREVYRAGQLAALEEAHAILNQTMGRAPADFGRES